MTRAQANKLAKEFVKEVDLEPDETQKSWIEAYVMALEEDGEIK